MLAKIENYRGKNAKNKRKESELARHYKREGTEKERTKKLSIVHESKVLRLNKTFGKCITLHISFGKLGAKRDVYRIHTVSTPNNEQMQETLTDIVTITSCHSPFHGFPLCPLFLLFLLLLLLLMVVVVSTYQTNYSPVGVCLSALF